MRKHLLIVSLSLALPLSVAADGKKTDPPPLAGTPAPSTQPAQSQAQKNAPSKKGEAPSLAKAAKLPPGLEKKFGTKRPNVAYVAFDPKNVAEAWLLIDGKWKLEKNFDVSVKKEVKASLALPTTKPPVPLPKTAGRLKVVKFE